MKIPWAKPFLRVGVVATEEGLEVITERAAPCELVEIRVDCLLKSGLAIDQIGRRLARKRHPALLTLRAQDEGGQVAMPDAERLRLIEELRPLVEAVDVEARHVNSFKSLLQSGRKRPVDLILSAHHFDITPPLASLKRQLAGMRRTSARIFKIAVRCDNYRAFAALIRLQVEERNTNALAVMGMGEFAAESRKLLPLLGARLIYGFLDAPTAPGQPSVAELTAP